MQNVLLSRLENTDMNHSISILAYISQITSNFLQQHEVETLCLDLYHCLNTNESTRNVKTILTCLENVEKQNYLILNNYTIHIRNKCFFKLVLLATLRHFKEVFNKSNATITIQQKHEILQAAMLTFRVDKIESLLVLRLIDNLIKKNKCLLERDLALRLLLFSQTVAISPFEGFKSYAHNISKIALLMLDSKYIKNFLDLNLLPIKGLETIELVPYFKQVSHDRIFLGKLVTKVIQMFSNNIENRDGGFLYRSVLFEDFSYWKEVVWPHFFIKFQMIDFEGEFIQSLVKYWIPQCVSAYKLEFYTFICTIPISNYLKGYILLETRRKGIIGNYNEDMIQLLNSLFADESTSLLALKIVSSYFKSSIYPCDIELQLVNSFIYGQREALNNEQLNCLHIFWSQIGVVGSELFNLDLHSAVKEHWLDLYKNHVMDLFTFCLKVLQSGNKNMGAQILRLFWKLANDESPYLLNYKLDKECLGFYSHIFLYKEVYIELIEKTLLESNGNFLELTKLGQLILPETRLYQDNYLLKFIDDCTELNSIMATESVKNVSRIVVFQNKPDENVTLLHNLFDAVNKHFQHFSPNLKSVFKEVLLLEAILEVSKVTHSLEGCTFVGFDTYCLPVIVDILQNDVVEEYYEQEIKKCNLDSADHQYSLLCKIQKIVESLLNNMLQYILQDNNIWHILDKPKAMDLLVNIIETSNMRRPTTLSADVLKHVAKLIDQESQKDQINVDFEVVQRRNEESSYKIRLLYNTLEKLSAVASLQNLTIRRNPESRLIVHALCQSDGHPQKPLLAHTLLYLLKLLADPRSKDSTVSSAMHCTEILILDSALYNHTLRFVPDVTIQCVRHFKNRNWIVRNANIQLARSLIDRFLGVLIGNNNRPKSVEDLFRLFPQLITCFCQTLTQMPLADSAIIVMQIFFESQIKRRPLQSEYLVMTRNTFLRLFTLVIKENANHYGLFAVRAYISLCFDDEIPDVIGDVVNFIVANHISIRAKHTIRNFVQLLHELTDKYLGYIDESPIKPCGFYAIQGYFDRISTFIKPFNSKQFDLLLFKTLSIDDVATHFETSNFDMSDYSQRVWLHNYVPLLIINANTAHLSEILAKMLSKNIMGCMEVKILSILVDRYSKNHFSSDVLGKIVNVLVQKALVTDDTCCYLLLCYFKVVFLFFHCHKTLKIAESCVKNARRCYGTVNNIHKIFVVILLLAQVPSKNDYDKKFIKTAVRRFQNLNLTNFETALMLSNMLPSIYKNIYCICDKYRIFKIAAFLVVEHGLYNFVSFITKSRISSPLFAMIKILDFRVLVRHLGDGEIACKFIKEFYETGVMDCPEDSNSKINRTYYVAERSIYVDRLFINRIVLKFLRDFNMTHGNLEWFHYYKLLQSQNKG